MNNFSTVVVRVCILAILGLPTIAVLTRPEGLTLLPVATMAAVSLSLVGALVAWQRVVSTGKLHQALPDDVEAARRVAQLLIFPELRFFGCNSPRVSQLEWNKCAESPKSVATLLILPRISYLWVLIPFLVWVALEYGVFQSIGSRSTLLKLFPSASLPIVRAVGVSLLCFVLLGLFNLSLCRISASRLKHSRRSKSRF